MPRRKELKHVAFCVLQSFISRNNDIEGYWAIGKIYLMLLHTPSLRLNLDLKNLRCSPEINTLTPVLEQYAHTLQYILKRKGFAFNALNLSMIEIIAYPNDPAAPNKNIRPHRLHCQIILKDDLNNNHCFEQSVWCWAHDPDKELKSSRTV